MTKVLPEPGGSTSTHKVRKHPTKLRSCVLELCVKFVALTSEKLPVVVALLVMVHPPPALTRERVVDDEFPGLILSPVSLELKSAVPLSG